MEELLALMIGIGLSAACGFRVFVPLLAMSLAAQTGHLELAGEFQQWLATPAATMALGVATFLEIGGYYIPWVDNMLDMVATPAAIVAGTLVTASVLPTEIPTDHVYATVDGASSVYSIVTDYMGKLTMIEHDGTPLQTGYGVFGDILRILEEPDRKERP
ncbi:MAG TPA: DUF4126 family protein [Bacillota bacterium]|nr:DUF4126 family protein [Bacillota bacterium]